MKQGGVYKGVMGAFGACLLLAGCSSSQKPAALAPVGGSATGTTASAASGSGTPTQSATSASGSSSPSGSTVGGGNGGAPAGAPTTVVTSSGGLTYKAVVPGDPDSSAALAAFEKYREIVFQMSAKADYSTNLTSYADGNPLALANNFVTHLKQYNAVMVGPTSENVTSSTLNMAASPLPLMTISVCKDDSKYHQVFSYGPKKGQLVVTDFTHPYPLTFTVHKSADGKWRVTSVRAESDKTC